MTNLTTGPARVAVEISTLWVAPTAVREVDAPAVADQPDLPAWVAAMDYDQRLDLLRRVDAQAVAGEPVWIDEITDGWARVVLPWQPSRKDARGYPGWLRAAHLEPSSTEPGQPERIADGMVILETARKLLGTEYVWGGLSSDGIDCSGFAHLVHRQHGLIIPRDASDQAKLGREVPLDALEEGALLFFAFENGAGAIHHVAFYAGVLNGEPTMLHAPKTGRVVELQPLSDAPYQSELCAARHFMS